MVKIKDKKPDEIHKEIVETAKLQLAILKENFKYRDFFENALQNEIFPIDDLCKEFDLNDDYFDSMYFNDIPFPEVLTLLNPQKELDEISLSPILIERLPSLFYQPGLRNLCSQMDDFSLKHKKITGSSLFRVVDLKDLTSLIVKLRDASNPLSEFLQEQFSSETQQLLSEYDDSSPPSPLLHETLITELNQLLQGPSLYDEGRFAHVSLSQETQQLIEQSPEGKELIRLNRLLLEEAYPHEIAKSQITYKKPVDLEPYERLLVIDLRKRKSQLIKELEAFIDVELIEQESMLRHKLPYGGYYLWEPENSRQRKEAWEQLRVFKAVIHQKKSYPQIAEENGINIKRVGETFRTAYEKTQGVPYDPSYYVNKRQECRDETLWAGFPCNMCADHKSCQGQCKAFKEWDEKWKENVKIPHARESKLEDKGYEEVGLDPEGIPSGYKSYDLTDPASRNQLRYKNRPISN